MILKQIKNQGFTLIEVIVAITIISVVFVGLIQTFPFGLSIIKASEDETVAAYLSQSKIEELFSLGYDNIATGTIESKAPLGMPGDYLYSFQRETIVNCLDDSLTATTTDLGMKMITSTTYYLNKYTKSEISFISETILTKR